MSINVYLVAILDYILDCIPFPIFTHTTGKTHFLETNSLFLDFKYIIAYNNSMSQRSKGFGADIMCKNSQTPVPTQNIHEAKQHRKSDVRLTVHRNSVWIRKTN